MAEQTLAALDELAVSTVDSTNADLTENLLPLTESLQPFSDNIQSAVSGPSLATVWDPTNCPDWDIAKPSEHCFLRIKRDMMTIFKDPPPGMVIVPDELDMTRIHALVTGPFDTPYEGGFFYFLIRCPPNYPISPPKVKLMTTGSGTVRFNPNFYKNGKVCLSILGTWSGPSWSPALSLSSLLISVQSLMNAKPYHNEPGYEKERKHGDVTRYNLIIQHETIRVAVLQHLDTQTTTTSIKDLPPLYNVVRTSFPQFYEYYHQICEDNVGVDGQSMRDPFGENRGTFHFKKLMDTLEAKKEEFSEWFDESEAHSEDSQLSDND